MWDSCTATPHPLVFTVRGDQRSQFSLNKLSEPAVATLKTAVMAHLTSGLFVCSWKGCFHKSIIYPGKSVTDIIKKVFFKRDLITRAAEIMTNIFDKVILSN